MQYGFPFDPDPPLARIHRRLLKAFGPLPIWPLSDPVDQLVLSLMGSRTRDEVSNLAFVRLRLRFGDWYALREAPIASIEALIEPVTFAERKAAWLPSALGMITAHRRELNLAFLGGWPVESAQQWLERLPGVGPKVSAAVLNFSTLRMRTLVVDSHHIRVVKRLHLLPSIARDKDAHRMLMRQLPADWTADVLDDHHMMMKSLGQRFCRAAVPICWRCPLRDFCPTGRSRLTRSSRRG